MSVQLKLRRDYGNGLFGFIEAASSVKEYSDIVVPAIKQCKAREWLNLKQVFLTEPTLPLLAPVAEALERAMLAHLQTSKN
jgi:hypothetical protein